MTAVFNLSLQRDAACSSRRSRAARTPEPPSMHSDVVVLLRKVFHIRCRDVYNSLLAARGVPAAARELLTQQKLNKFDNTPVRLWYLFAKVHKFHMTQATVRNVTEFFAWIEQRCPVESRIITRCTTTLTLLFSGKVMKNKDVRKVLSQAKKLHWTPPELRDTWDPKIILELLQTWDDNKNLHIADLGAKCMMLILLATGRRMQALRGMSLKAYKRDRKGQYYHFCLQTPQKLCDPQRRSPDYQMIVSAFPGNSKLCPVKALDVYLSRTKHVRETDFVFFPPTKPNTPCAPDTIRKWIKCILSEAALGRFKASSSRAAAASLLNRLQYPIQNIFRHMNWKSQTVFNSNYNLPLSRDVAEAVGMSRALLTGRRQRVRKSGGQRVRKSGVSNVKANSNSHTHTRKASSKKSKRPAHGGPKQQVAIPLNPHHVSYSNKKRAKATPLLFLALSHKLSVPANTTHTVLQLYLHLAYSLCPNLQEERDAWLSIQDRNVNQKGPFPTLPSLQRSPSHKNTSSIQDRSVNQTASFPTLPSNHTSVSMSSECEVLDAEYNACLTVSMSSECEVVLDADYNACLTSSDTEREDGHNVLTASHLSSDISHKSSSECEVVEVEIDMDTDEVLSVQTTCNLHVLPTITLPTITLNCAWPSLPASHILLVPRTQVSECLKVLSRDHILVRNHMSTKTVFLPSTDMVNPMILADPAFGPTINVFQSIHLLNSPSFHNEVPKVLAYVSSQEPFVPFLGNITYSFGK